MKINDADHRRNQKRRLTIQVQTKQSHRGPVLYNFLSHRAKASICGRPIFVADSTGPIEIINSVVLILLIIRRQRHEPARAVQVPIHTNEILQRPIGGAEPPSRALGHEPSRGHAPHWSPTVRAHHSVFELHLPFYQARPRPRPVKSPKYPSVDPQMILFFIPGLVLAHVADVQQVAPAVLRQEALTRSLREPRSIDPVTRRGLTQLEMPSRLAAAAEEHELGQRVPPTADPTVERAVRQCCYHARGAIHADRTP